MKRSQFSARERSCLFLVLVQAKNGPLNAVVNVDQAVQLKGLVQ